MKDATQQMMTRDEKLKRLHVLEDEADLLNGDQQNELALLRDELAVKTASPVEPETASDTAPQPQRRRRATPKEAIEQKRKEKGPQEIKLLLHRETSSYTLLDSEEKEGMAKLDVLRSPDNYEIIIGRKLVAEINWK